MQHIYPVTFTPGQNALHYKFGLDTEEKLEVKAKKDRQNRSRQIHLHGNGK